MAFYRQCPDCGCNLDPGERCMCREKSAAKTEHYKKILKEDPKTKQLKLDFAAIAAAGRFMAVAVAAAVAITPMSASAAEEISDTWLSEEVQDLCVKYGTEYGICPELLMAIIERESSGVIMAQNGDCRGLMQISVDCHKDRMERLGVTDIFDAENNVRVGADYLAELFGQYEEAALVLDYYNGNSKAEYYDSNGLMSSYADGILERSAELERLHGK